MSLGIGTAQRPVDFQRRAGATVFAAVAHVRPAGAK
jgi:hypothetical protein